MGSTGNKFLDIATGNIGGLFGGGPDVPTAPGLPAPVEEVDVAGQRQYTQARLKQRKGRASTILTKLGDSGNGGKSILG